MKFKGTLTIELTDKTYNTNKTDIKTQSVAFRSIARQVLSPGPLGATKS